MPGAVFAADLHLAKCAWSRRPEIQGDSFSSFRQIVARCLQERLALILGGDVIDTTTPSPDVVQLIYQQFDAMRAVGLPVYYIQGQHELNREVPWLSVHPWPKHMHEKSFEVAGIKYYGLDWLPSPLLQEALAKIPPDTQTLVCHQVWKEFMGIGTTDGSMSEVPYVSKILTGDYHVCRTHEGVGATGQPFTAYSTGSTCMQEISEPVEKYYFKLGPAVPEVVKLGTRAVYHYQLLTQEALEQFCADPHPALVMDGMCWLPLVRVTYLDSLPDVQSRIKAAMHERCHLFLKPVEASEETIQVDFAALSQQGSFANVQRAIEALTPAGSPLSQGCQRLWQQDDVAATIDELRREFIESKQPQGHHAVKERDAAELVPVS